MIPTTLSRTHFDKVLNSYKEYVSLYRFLNRGSIEGITPFDDFYWRMQYHYKYKNKTFFQGM